MEARKLEDFLHVRPVVFVTSALFTLGRKQFQHEQTHSDHDRHVGDVEVGPRISTPQSEMQKVDDLLAKDSVDEVSHRTTEDQPERERREAIPRGELPIERDDDSDRDDRDTDEKCEPRDLRCRREQSERCAGVSNVSQVEETVDDRDPIRVTEVRIDRDFRSDIEQETESERKQRDTKFQRHEASKNIIRVPARRTTLPYPPNAWCGIRVAPTPSFGRDA